MAWNFADMWESVSDAVGDHVALIQGDRRVTWTQFDDRAARLAAALAGAGLSPGSKVASYCYNSNEYSEGVFATFKMRGVPVNVNYRYLEDELAYLIDNSDAEALLFHGELGDRVAKIRAQAPHVKLWIQVDDGSPQQEFAVKYEELIATHEPMPRIERSGDDLYFLYTGGTTGMPKGVMWRNEDLVRVLIDAAYLLAGHAPPERPEQTGEFAREIVETGVERKHLPASPLMHGTGGFSSFQALLVGSAIITLVGRHFDAHELWETVQRERCHADGDRRRRVRQADGARARGGGSARRALRPLVAATHHQLGVMWSTETKQALIARGSFICCSTGSARAKASGSPAQHQRPRLEARHREVLGRDLARRCSPTTAGRCAGLRRASGMLARRRQHPGRLLQGPERKTRGARSG